MSNESNNDLFVEGNTFDFLTDNRGKNYNLCHCMLSFFSLCFLGCTDVLHGTVVWSNLRTLISDLLGVL